ncbi:MAG: hypothetical protein O6942_01520, partial [Bacteroidetes bacterium]|nr:hypothetical protein [Bacteroidota bacterium]
MELQRLLAEGVHEATIRFVKEKVLESYRNEINVGKSAEKQTRKQPAKVASSFRRPASPPGGRF